MGPGRDDGAQPRGGAFDRAGTFAAVAAEHAGPRSLRQLLDAVLTIGSDLDLHSVLRRIVEAGVELVGARYGALGVLDESRTRLSDFITVGMDDATVRAIGDLPKGLGLLGALITDAKPLRAADLREHVDSAGFPANHPRMTSFLGVPVRVRSEVFGNLYLTDKRDGEVFTDIDEELALGLAAAAGVAIDNARLFGQVRQREAALAAVHDVATVLMAGMEEHESRQLVAHHARGLVAADLATVAMPLPDGRSLELDVVDGDLASGLVGRRFARAGSISGEILDGGGAIVVDDLALDHRSEQPQVTAGDLGPAIFVGLFANGATFGTLAAIRARGAAPFTKVDVELLSSFAAQASIALEVEQGRRAGHRLGRLEDQERIARDLHDTVIQRLFATGLALQGAGRLVTDREARRRIDQAVDELDATVRQIRTVIFDVERGSVASLGLRSDVVDLAREAGRSLGFEPRVAFDGPVDTLVPPHVAAELLATLREALSNVARHAEAQRVEVEVAVEGGLVLTVRDDGRGFDGTGAAPGSLGVANMRARAEHLGGDLLVTGGPGKGTELVWRVPLVDRSRS
jgi:signal transduction histidine kinase